VAAKPSSRELSFKWYLEPNDVANAILAELMQREDACEGIPERTGVRRNVWGCDDLDQTIVKFFEAKNVHGAKIVVWIRSEDKTYIIRKGSVNT
jgi:hypothetical protein